jgi:uncharacterized protein YecE (DUF72 family)
MRWLVGTSGFSYDEWAGAFYPEGLPGARRLAFYGEHLPSVEINNTFYRMPRESVLESWAAQVSPDFRFALKASRRITHAKASEPVDADAVSYLFRVADALGERLGVVLFQLPPWQRKDVARLRELLSAVPAGRRIAVEFRHRSWLDDEVYAALRSAGASLCASDFDDPETGVPIVDTASFGYLRLRAADYDEAALRRWVAEIGSRPWEEAYVFFKHEDEGAAPRLASELLAIATGEAPRLGPRRALRPTREPMRARPATLKQGKREER